MASAFIEKLFSFYYSHIGHGGIFFLLLKYPEKKLHRSQGCRQGQLPHTAGMGLSRKMARILKLKTWLENVFPLGELISGNVHTNK